MLIAKPKSYYRRILLGEALVHLVKLLRPHQGKVFFYGERNAYKPFVWSNQIVQLRPDGMGCLCWPGGQTPLFFEIDNGDRPTILLAQMTCYEAYYKSEVWRRTAGSRPSILFIVWDAHENEAERIELAEKRLIRIAQRIDEHRTNLDVRWLFSRLDQVGSGQWRQLGAQRGDMQTFTLF